MSDLISELTERIVNSVLNGNRISIEEAHYLYETLSLSQIGIIADIVKQTQTGNTITYIQNIHIEPTNICVFDCKFCSFSTTHSNKGWSLSIEEILETVSKLHSGISEIHMVGGSNPNYDISFYNNLIRQIKSIKPDVHIKAFTASEIHYMAQLENITISDTLNSLKSSGLDSIPGGGAEILNDNIRNQICPKKINSKEWLHIHEQAHLIGIISTCTMLYGHIETLNDRLQHLGTLRTLQDTTNGFQAFIPLKFKRSNNVLSHINETNSIEDLKMFAISRIFLDNIKHIKAYWPAFGKNIAQMALRFGADDIDGTISDSTKIYSTAGAEEQHPDLSIHEVKTLIEQTGYIPAERNAMFDIKINH
jgi:aminodeoxyfutalosine synthase